MDKISIIIPAHNASRTILRTIRSVARLQLKNVEILIVENGSTDDTLQLALQETENHQNLKVFQSEKGVSRARNVGLDRAEGQWIVFVDADDECLESLKQLSDQISGTETDLYIAGYMKDADIIRHQYRKLNTVITANSTELEEAKAWLISKPTLRMQAWAKVYRADFLRKNKLRFNEELSYSEDSEFMIRVLEACKSLMITDMTVYLYHSDTSSAMRGKSAGRTEAYIRALEVAEDDVEKAGPLVKSAFIDYVIAHVNIIAVHDIFGYDVKISWKQRKQLLRELLKTEVISRNISSKADERKFDLQRLPVALCMHQLITTGSVLFSIRSLQNRRRQKKALS